MSRGRRCHQPPLPAGSCTGTLSGLAGGFSAGRRPPHLCFPHPSWGGEGEGFSAQRQGHGGGAQEAWPWLSRPRWPQAITWDGGSQHWLLSGPAEICQRPRVHAAPRLDESGSGWGPRARSAHYNQLRPAACDAGPGPSTGEGETALGASRVGLAHCPQSPLPLAVLFKGLRISPHHPSWKLEISASTTNVSVHSFIPRTSVQRRCLPRAARETERPECMRHVPSDRDL